MIRCLTLVLACGLVGSACASWYWPFGSSDDGKTPPRLSELMEPASELIDEASDLAADGKVQEAVEKYRAALVELDAIERASPERAATPEFATLRNKRAYVNAAIDSMLLSQVRSNAKVVAVSDTTELERRLQRERDQQAGKKSEPEAEEETEKASEKVEPSAEDKPAEQSEPTKTPSPKTEGGKRSWRDLAMEDLSNGDYASAELSIREWLAASPDHPAALNLKAVLEVNQGRFKEAEATLDRAIMMHPRNHFAYYNMANLLLQTQPGGKSAAKRYYATGRSVGGPVDADLEAALK